MCLCENCRTGSVTCLFCLAVELACWCYKYVIDIITLLPWQLSPCAGLPAELLQSLHRLQRDPQLDHYSIGESLSCLSMCRISITLTLSPPPKKKNKHHAYTHSLYGAVITVFSHVKFSAFHTELVTLPEVWHKRTSAFFFRLWPQVCFFSGAPLKKVLYPTQLPVKFFKNY